MQSSRCKREAKESLTQNAKSIATNWEEAEKCSTPIEIKKQSKSEKEVQDLIPIEENNWSTNRRIKWRTSKVQHHPSSQEKRKDFIQVTRMKNVSTPQDRGNGSTQPRRKSRKTHEKGAKLKTASNNCAKLKAQLKMQKLPLNQWTPPWKQKSRQKAQRNLKASFPLQKSPFEAETHK
jgi:hypothetical protein